MNWRDAYATLVVVLCCMHCTSTRPEQVLWSSLVAALRHLCDMEAQNLAQRLTNGFCHRCGAVFREGASPAAFLSYEPRRKGLFLLF